MVASASEPPRARPRRIDSIDFWRGLVLCTIFINHIPGNLFEFITQKNFGFSDSAEAFVFLSGVSLALAYGSRFARSQRGQAFGALGRRAVRLYGLHILLSLAGLGIFAAAEAATADTTFLKEHGRDLFVDDPGAALVGLASLGHQLGYFNILPLYVVLLGPASLMLWGGQRHPRAMLILSFAVYLAARLWAINIPTWPMKGSWFFDPFAWQFLMALGIYAGAVLRDRGLPRSRGLIWIAAAIVAFGAVSVTNGFGLDPGLRDWAATWADLDKTMLGWGRIVHFLAVAYLIAALDVSSALRRGMLFAPLCRLGRHSLPVFSLLSLLAALGQVLAQRFGHSLPLDSVLLVAGLGGLYGVASLLEARRVTLLPAGAKPAGV